MITHPKINRLRSQLFAFSCIHQFINQLNIRNGWHIFQSIVQTSSIVSLFPACFLRMAVPTACCQIIDISHLVWIPFNWNDMIDNISGIYSTVFAQAEVALKNEHTKRLPLTRVVELILL